MCKPATQTPSQESNGASSESSDTKFPRLLDPFPSAKDEDEYLILGRGHRSTARARNFVIFYQV